MHDKPKKKRTPQPFEKVRFDDEDLQRMHDPHDPLAREHDEPWEGSSEMPFLLFVAVTALAFFTGAYLLRYSYGFDFFIYDHNLPLTTDTGSNEEIVWDPLAQGEKLFKKNCTQCHQTNGQGVPGSYPSLIGSSWVIEDPQTPIRILLKGLEGPITVNGNEYNGAMPAFGKKFDDRQLAAVLTYVRQAWGNSAPAVDEATVKAVREATAERNRVWSAPELLQLRQ